jgi:hypothetical protein
MSGKDLIIVLAPWMIFAAALVIILIRLRWPSRPLRRPPHTQADQSHKHQPHAGASDGEPAASSGEAARPPVLPGARRRWLPVRPRGAFAAIGARRLPVGRGSAWG